MRFRKLRIAWSVFWGVAAVLLIVFWLRSYSWADKALVPRPGGTVIVLGSGHGKLQFGRVSNDVVTEWSYWQEEAKCYGQQYSWGSQRHWYLPYWFPVLITAASSLLPWIGQLKCRFSLRTLLIATTLVAAVLGLVVYAASK